MTISEDGENPAPIPREPQFAESGTARSWRQIPREVKLPAMSTKGRRRAFAASAKIVGAILAAAILAVAGVSTYEARRGDSASTPLKTVDLRTDGILDREWAEGIFSIPPRTALGELNLETLRNRLFATGRVETASLSLKYPSTLVVAITERYPVARIRTGDHGDLWVARDGVVFGSAGERDHKAFEGLPWLDGIRLLRTETGFEPIPGMKTAADLLATARNETPEIYSTWVSLNLSRLATDRVLEVRGKAIPKVVFGTATDFFVQLARLDYVIDHAPKPLKSVDLSVGSNAVMIFDEAGTPAPPLDTRRASIPARFNLTQP